MKTNQTHGVPALISLFIPGAGQLIKGHIGLAIFYFCVAIVAYILILAIIGLALVPLVHVFSAADAYNNNTGEFFKNN